MKIFQLENNNVVVTPEVLTIPEFHVLYKRDKTKSKDKSFAEFCYIYHVCEFNSPYRVYSSLDERKVKVAKDFIKDDSWKEDESILAAINKYNELMKTPSMGLLEDSYIMVESLRKYFRESKNIPIMDSKEASAGFKNLESLGKTIESLKKLEEVVAKEKAQGVRTRGDIEIGYDERG